MELSELVALQQKFDENHSLAFDWSQPITDGDPRTLVHIALALAGEVGELANVVKKYDRGDIPFDDTLKLLPDELADIFIYLIKLSYQTGIDLESAFLNKLDVNEKRFANALKQTEAPHTTCQ
ncbi:MazG nucleotide pyrophosphohydrolase domain-containing protein [Saccharothrix variisporea]|uniref:MazG-like nucleotide pyrophosphohydrolase family protein n=1 Tax=Saccharothrix variisporea TaxID=543527 RepID=A0A495XDU3_9PSEU|nr:MazG nucleotide pyrophosphohydrolase domain-containing protein [Saccharothrix variisporea]RKT72430.1 MazG-like nucleotide pyrophosphohydrolase family protein [Saccharothrix variisporea]